MKFELSRGDWAAALFFATGMILGCHGGPQRKLPAKAPFIALERDFQGFQSWETVDISKRPGGIQTHESPDAQEYINQQPPTGSKQFPVGTILVKSTKKEAGKQDIFAMVKRGDGYNAKGAPGWEWFELTRRPDQSLAIVWRGMNPPDGQGYGGLPSGGCNDCHRNARGNDFVHARQLASSKI